MGWTEQKAAIARDVIAEFSDTVTFTLKGAISVQLTVAYFDRGYVEIIGKDPDGDPVHGVRPCLRIPSLYIGVELNRRPRRDDSFIVAGVEYRVEEVRDRASDGYLEILATEVR